LVGRGIRLAILRAINGARREKYIHLKWLRIFPNNSRELGDLFHRTSDDWPRHFACFRNNDAGLKSPDINSSLFQNRHQRTGDRRNA
jgi:hypothetical protein